MNALAEDRKKELVRHFAEHGYFIVEPVFSEVDVDGLQRAIEGISVGEEVKRRQGVYGVRNLLEKSAEIRSLACDPRVRDLVEAILGTEAFAVRAVFFDKIPGANWSLFWHQDNIISVKNRLDVPGFTGWSNKAGVWQVQPPAEILGSMLAIRIHLDDCGPDNGPLRVLPGSHRFGWQDDHLDDWKQRVPEVVCLAKKGGVVAMCPLIFHASAPADRAGHRRVIHLEYANENLPSGLDWNNHVR